VIKIKKVITKSQWQTFLHLPWKIYKNDPYWVPPLLKDVKFCLDEKENPFYEHAYRELFLAYKNEEALGRIVAIVDENYNDYHHEKIGWFGFLETVNDFTVISALIDIVKEYLAHFGMKYLYGPVNPSTNETCGLLVEGFDDPPCFLMAYNPPYYAQLLEKCGFKKIKDLLAYETSLPFSKTLLQRFENICICLKNRYPELKVRHIYMEDFEKELKRIQEVYNEAWSRNWGFVPMTEAEIRKMAERLKPLVVPEFVWLAEIREEPIAFMMFLPDYFQVFRHLNGRFFLLNWLKFFWYRRKINRIRVVTLGVKRQYHHSGVVPLFLLQAGKTLLKFPYKRLEFSWILEDNLPVIRIAELINASLKKRYRIYGIKIN